MNLLEFAGIQTEVFILYFLRGAGFLFVAPIFSARAVPVHVKVGIAGFLAYVFLLINQPSLPASSYELTKFAPMAIGELIIGLAMGFSVGIIFVCFQFAGRIFGYQMGFAIVNVLDPHSQEQVSLIGEFLFAVVSLVFLNLNLHHSFLTFFGRSFEWVPAGGINAAAFTMTGIGDVMTSLFILSLQIAAPLLAVLFMLDFGLGIIARVVPQMNVFLVGIPLKIAGGLFMLSIIVMLLNPVTWKVTERIMLNTMEVVKSLGSA